MIFNAIELEDFGIYAGRQRLDLTTRPQRPVILVGGTNGAGKTTLLEAFTLCLHGRRALGPRVSNDAYEAHIRSRFHHAPHGEVAAECGITLSFDHVHSGRSAEYAVSRRWLRLQNGTVRESLALKLNGEEIDDLSDASRQDFLDSLLPPGLAGFFLFDGEQIQALADDENGVYLADAVKRLLGLDLIDQLQADLRRFIGGAAKGKGGKVAKTLAEAEREVAKAREKLEQAEENRACVQERQDKLDEELARAQDHLAREGGTLAAERTSLEKKAGKAKSESDVAEEQLRALIAGLLPFAIAQDLADDVAKRLEAEQSAEEDEIIAGRIKAAAKELKAELRTKEGKPVTPARLAQLLEVERARARRLHDVSAAERAVMLEQLRLVRDDVRADAIEVGKRLRRAHDKSDRLRNRLDEVPQDEAFAPLVEKLQEIEHGRGQSSADMERVEDELRVAQNELGAAERKLDKLEGEAKKASKGVESVEMATRTIDLLEEYGTQTETRRLEQIELEAARYFNRLSRKGELLSKITIDRDSFRVRVIRWDQTELPKERLSAGEKQLLAIAILWSLAKASQRPLPVVVDTPLARLDLEHRKRLLSEYLPNVSHQVVVLSTDTEVDLAAAAELEDVTARRIFLSHDLDSAATAVAEGYFSPAAEAVSGAR
ncbi:MAG TPA: DNA sulfur modification protein DndD [Solirubrobacterales bacterium]|nr:DNA sulfur modification protein DndD [Solirubrobacterales bacterium]